LRKVFDKGLVNQMLEEMEKGTEYHEIFKICKDRVIQFSEILGKSLVIEFQDKLTHSLPSNIY
jgi:hypothetical protein